MNYKNNIEGGKNLTNEEINSILKKIDNPSEMILRDFSISEETIENNPEIIDYIIEALKNNLKGNDPKKINLNLNEKINELNFNQHLIVSILNIVRGKKGINKRNPEEKVSDDDIKKGLILLNQLMNYIYKGEKSLEMNLKNEKFFKYLISIKSEEILESNFLFFCIKDNKKIIIKNLKELKKNNIIENGVFLKKVGDIKTIKIILLYLLEVYKESKELKANINFNLTEKEINEINNSNNGEKIISEEEATNYSANTLSSQEIGNPILEEKESVKNKAQEIINNQENNNSKENKEIIYIKHIFEKLGIENENEKNIKNIFNRINGLIIEINSYKHANEVINESRNELNKQKNKLILIIDDYSKKLNYKTKIYDELLKNWDSLLEKYKNHKNIDNYNELKKEKDKIELELNNSIKELNSLKILEKKLENIIHENNNLKSELEKQKYKIEELEENNKNKDDEIEELEDENKKQANEIEELKKQLDFYQNGIKHSTSEIVKTYQRNAG